MSDLNQDLDSAESERNEQIIQGLKLIFATLEGEIACDDCFNQMDEYVDMLRNGGDPVEVLPRVKLHLDRCHGCTEEFEALMKILEGQADSDRPPASG